MRTAETEVGQNLDEVRDELYRGLAAELNHAQRYFELARLAAVGGLTGTATILARIADGEWQHVAALMRRITQMGGDLASHPVTAADSGLLARISHPSGTADPGSHLRALLFASVQEDRSTIRFYADLCDQSWDVDQPTAELALRCLIEETEAEDRLTRLLAEWREGS